MPNVIVTVKIVRSLWEQPGQIKWRALRDSLEEDIDIAVEPHTDVVLTGWEWLVFEQVDKLAELRLELDGDPRWVSYNDMSRLKDRLLETLVGFPGLPSDRNVSVLIHRDRPDPNIYGEAKTHVDTEHLAAELTEHLKE